MSDKEQQKERKGFSYHVTDEQIEAYRKLPIEERLRWLEEAREFLAKILPNEQLEIMEKFRRGEI
jgi:hypothetical protein